MALNILGVLSKYIRSDKPLWTKVRLIFVIPVSKNISTSIRMNLDVYLLFILGGHMEKGETVSVKTKPKRFVMFCAILVTFVQLKNMENTHGRVLLLVTCQQLY